MIRRILFLGLLALALSACDTGIKQMGATEYGVVVRKLPPTLGGGVSNKVVSPGQMVIVWPWDSVYKFDTAVQDISWGKGASGSTGDQAEEISVKELGGSQRALDSDNMVQWSAPGYVNTRALDGNEVALAVTVRYKITTEPDTLIRMVKEFATNDDEIRYMVIAVARADIRTFMNQLRTSEFLQRDPRYQAVDKVRDSIAKRLNPYGIEIRGVNLNDFRFERVLADGSVDTSYQDRLKEIQKTREDTEREKSRIETVRAKKSQEFNEAQADVNRVVAEANGVRDQAKIRGDAYLDAKRNDAKGILARGEGEVKGLIEQINALSGPGGEEILKLELVRYLTRNNPQFVVMQSGGAQSIDVRRMDSNQLMGQLGLIESLIEPKKINSAKEEKKGE